MVRHESYRHGYQSTHVFLMAQSKSHHGFTPSSSLQCSTNSSLLLSTQDPSRHCSSSPVEAVALWTRQERSCIPTRGRRFQKPTHCGMNLTAVSSVIQMFMPGGNNHYHYYDHNPKIIGEICAVPGATLKD